MNLLKQTALVLGLVSLSLGGWSLFRNWRQRLAILYSILCFIVAAWALSFVSHATLGGRLSKDIHWVFNVWIAPIGVLIVSKILSKPDRWGKWLFRISLIGAIPLNIAISFSIYEITRHEWFWHLVSFWPTFVLLEYLHVMVADLLQNRPVDLDFISSGKRKALYAGLGLSLATCTFDHVPWTGPLIPSLGNLAFTGYLAFASQILSPERLLGLEAVLSRFFAMLILSLVITGYFALLYQYMSENFGLFVLNSFLLSLSILVLWSPLVTLFRLIARRMFRTESQTRRALVERFQLGLSGVTSQAELRLLMETFFEQALRTRDVTLEVHLEGLKLPDAVQSYFAHRKDRREPLILHRTLVQMERDGVLTQERRRELDLLLEYLDLHRCDLVFAVVADWGVIAVVRVALQTSLDEWNVSLGFYTLVESALRALSPALLRIQQVESTLERDRLALLGEMAAGLAHEIRNPLGAIKGASELILRPDGQPEARWAGVIREEADRLNRLVSQFLDFSQSAGGAPESVNLTEFVEHVVGIFAASVPMSVRLDLKPADRVYAQVVPDQIQQVLMNLLQNALKATLAADSSHEGNRIRVEVFATGFLIEDHGIGMSEETLAKVFQPFFSGFKSGSGLGLSICQRLVAANRGTIEIRSRLGEGTTVKVNLCATKSSSSTTNPT